jgi:hypothetical protein
MPWHTVDGRRYYYRNVCRHGRSVRLYVGTGRVGELAATEDSVRQVHGEIEARQRRVEEGRLREAVERLLRLCHSIEVVARAPLTAGGYHRHQRGEWRRRHDSKASA